MRTSNVRLAALGVASALLVGSMSISPAWSYFTDSHMTEGKVRVTFHPQTDIVENWDNLGKHIKIKNTSKDANVYVRARAYISDNTVEDGSVYIGNADEYGKPKADLNNNDQLPPATPVHWFDGGDGWWYYSDSVKPDSTAEELLVKFDFKTLEELTMRYPDGSEEKMTVTDHTGENPNVVVSYEGVPVIQEGVNPKTVDWTLADQF